MGLGRTLKLIYNSVFGAARAGDSRAWKPLRVMA